MNNLISKFKNAVSKKVNDQMDVVDINNLYGVFVAGDNNKFILCKEEKFSYSEEPHLVEFFTGEIIDFSEVRFNKVVCPWREIKKHYFMNLLECGVCYPMVNLIGKYHKDGKITKKDIAYLYCVINEYLKENPEFINQLLESEKTR